MEEQKDDKGKGKQFRWPKYLSRSLLQILAEEALKPNKPSSTFGSETFTRVAKMLSDKHSLEITAINIENHMKTIKKEWQVITKLKAKSGFGWDDNVKMITVDETIYDEEVKAHPKHEKFLNKKIDMYEEMAIVVGKDMATGNYAKSFVDINIDSSVEVDSNPMEHVAEVEGIIGGKETSSTINPLSQKRPYRKKARTSEEEGTTLDKVTGKDMREIAVAIRDLTKNQFDIERLNQEVMQVEGFTEDELDTAFDYLLQHESIAKGFMVKNASLKRKWVQNFIDQL